MLIQFTFLPSTSELKNNFYKFLNDCAVESNVKSAEKRLEYVLTELETLVYRYKEAHKCEVTILYKNHKSNNFKKSIEVIVDHSYERKL